MRISPENWFVESRCFSTLGCAEMDLAATAELCARHQVPLLEIRALEDRLDLPAYFHETFGSPDALREKLREFPIQVQVLDSSFSLVNPAAQDKREELISLVEWADALAVPFIRVFDGGKFAPEVDEQTIGQAAETVKWWQDIKATNGFHTDILVETHDSLCSSFNCLRLQEKLEEPLGLLWDTWHIWFKNQEPLADTWNELRPYIRHIHFKDGIREPQANYPYTYKLPGTGEFPIKELFQLLRDDNYQGAICLEWERKWHTYLPPLDDALGKLTGR